MAGLAVIVAATSVILAGPTHGVDAADERVLNVGLYTDPPSLDPHMTDLGTLIRELTNVYEPLLDPKGKLFEYEPVLATAWSVSDDGLTYTFQLRKNVKFSDGTPFTASAVKTSFDRVMALKRGPYPFLKDIKDLQVVDDHQVRIRLPQPSGVFLATLRNFMIVSPAALKANDAAGDQAKAWLNEHTAGTGPYRSDRWQRGSNLSLVRNTHYWKGWGANHFDRVNLRTILEGETQRLMLEQGQLDIAQIISIDSLPALKRNPNIKIVETPFGAQMYLLLNTAAPLTKDLRVRQALAHVWNHDKYRALRKGLAPRADGPAPNMLFGEGYSVRNPYPYELDKARKLLSDAGVGRGATLTFLLQKGDEQKRMQAEVLRDELASLGITLTFVEGAWPALLKRVTDWAAAPDPANAWHVIGFYKSPDVWTPWTYLYRMFHSATHPHKPTGQFNLANYSNPEVDRLMDEADRILDVAKAGAMWRKANETILADVPSIPIEKMIEVAVMRSDVQGYAFRTYDNGRALHYYELSRAPRR